jgi:predicted dehydrogenase
VAIRGALRTAVIGTRGHAQRVAIPTIQGSRQAALAGVLGSDRDRTTAAATQRDVPAYHSVDELIASGAIDAVWVTAPNHLHAQIAMELLRGGVSVLLEKPMATSESDAAQLVAAADSSSAVFRVAYQHRFRPAHRELKRAVANGSFGSIGHLRVHRNWTWPYFTGADQQELSAWRRSPDTSGGWSINDIGAHLIDMALWLSDVRPVAVLDCYFTRRHDGIPNDSSTFLTLRMGDTCLATIECSNVLKSPGSLVEVYGERGWARLMNSFQGRVASLTSFGEESTSSTTDMEAYAAMFADFAGACTGEPSEGATASESVLNVRIVQTARRNGKFLEDLG